MPSGACGPVNHSYPVLTLQETVIDSSSYLGHPRGDLLGLLIGARLVCRSAVLSWMMGSRITRHGTVSSCQSTIIHFQWSLWGRQVHLSDQTHWLLQVNLTTSGVYVKPLIFDYLLRFYTMTAMSYKRYSTITLTLTDIIYETDHITGSFPTACHISLIVILLFECCFVTVIDCTDCIHFLNFYRLVLYFISVCMSVYNCGLTLLFY